MRQGAENARLLFWLQRAIRLEKRFEQAEQAVVIGEAHEVRIDLAQFLKVKPRRRASDTVKIEDTQVYINDEPLYEPYINETCSATHCRDNTWEPLGQDEYFVMGDNRNHSTDSRSFGKIYRENIIGEALVRYWPPDKWSFLHKIRYPDDPFTETPLSEAAPPVCPPD